MDSQDKNEPDFFLIGAQKTGTTWLWDMLEQHPGTSLPIKKELHYFGSAELYARGDDWYYKYFDGLDSGKLIGEASTTYFYDYVSYWRNDSDQIEFDRSLPSIPELISQTYPEAKFVVILRDPVRRAISAYSHWMRHGNVSPLLGLKKVAVTMPKMRIMEYGLYAKYLRKWMEHIPPDRLRIIIYEDQVRKNWDQTLVDTYNFLGLDSSFKPESPDKRIYKRWSWTRIVFNYYTGSVIKGGIASTIGGVLDRFDVLKGTFISNEDIEYLRSVYLPQKEEIENLTGNDLACWDYGEGLLRT